MNKYRTVPDEQLREFALSSSGNRRTVFYVYLFTRFSRRPRARFSAGARVYETNCRRGPSTRGTRSISRRAEDEEEIGPPSTRHRQRPIKTGVDVALSSPSNGFVFVSRQFPIDAVTATRFAPVVLKTESLSTRTVSKSLNRFRTELLIRFLAPTRPTVVVQVRS